MKFVKFIAVWVGIGYLYEYHHKLSVLDKAIQAAKETGKPLLNAGCGQWFEQAINAADVNMDIVPRDVPRFAIGSIEDIPFLDKQFGAVFCTHVIEHVDNPGKALRELERVSDYQFIITPLPLWPQAWLNPDHKRMYVGDRIIEFNA